MLKVFGASAILLNRHEDSTEASFDDVYLAGIM